MSLLSPPLSLYDNFVLRKQVDRCRRSNCAANATTHFSYSRKCEFSTSGVVGAARADLTEAVFQAVGLSRTDSAQMVEDMLEEVCGALAKGETVKLSSFGTFAVRQKSQRMGRNPKTGDEVPIAPRRVLVFRPSHVLKAVINGQTVAPEGED